MRMLRDWGAAVLIGMVVFFAVDRLSRGADPTGKPAPAFALETPTGDTVRLADYAGAPLVLNFWGSWCPPCRAEIPEFAAWSAAHPDVPILGIAARSGSGAKLANDAARLGVTWAVLEANDAVLSAYDVNAFPTTVVIAADGSIRGIAQGAIDGRGLDQLLAAAE